MPDEGPSSLKKCVVMAKQMLKIIADYPTDTP